MVGRVAALILLFLCAACGGNANVGANQRAFGDEGAAVAIAVIPSAEERRRLADDGAGVFKKYACGSCHSRTTDRQSLAGPPLGDTAKRHLTRQGADELAARRWFFAHVRNPAGHPGSYHGDGAYAATKMPAYPQISEDELRALVEFLMTMR